MPFWDVIRLLSAENALYDVKMMPDGDFRPDDFKAEVLFACLDGVEVGFALFFHNFSTFLGRAGIYLEDLFVTPEHRGKGCGRALLKKLAQIAVERGCGRLEWACLDWNRPSIDLYLSLGAQQMADWTTYRLTGKALREMGNKENT